MGVRHVVHLVGYAFEPGLVGFDEGDDAGEFLAHHGLGYERFGEDDALVAPLEALFEDGAGPAGHHAGHHPAFLEQMSVGEAAVRGM